MSKFTSEHQPTHRTARSKGKKTLFLEQYGSVFDGKKGINAFELLTVITTKILSKQNNSIAELELLRKVAIDVMQYTWAYTKDEDTDVTIDYINSDAETFIMSTDELLKSFRVNDTAHVKRGNDND